MIKHVLFHWFRRLLKNIRFSTASVYCTVYYLLLNTSVLSLTVFSLQFCTKYFDVKLENQAKLDKTETFSYVFMCF